MGNGDARVAAHDVRDGSSFVIRKIVIHTGSLVAERMLAVVDSV
jgi:hypothetical protein